MSQPPAPLAAVESPELSSCSCDTIQQEMERLPQGTRRLAIRLRLALDPRWIWEVLTDYSNLSCYVPNLASSRQLWRRGNRVGLEQVGTQKFLGLRFTAKVELELEENREAGTLRFSMRQGDFRRFEGSWQINSFAEGDRQGSSLVYELTVQGHQGMPIGLIEQRLRDDLASNLRAVQKEAHLRAGLAEGPV